MKNVLKESILPAFWLLYFFICSGNDTNIAKYDTSIANVKKTDLRELKTKISFNLPNTDVFFYIKEK